ncbi:MAG: hypothetical protein IPF51_07075, partial [Dehalococcoidia bacterium]|uniref:hypothetical protein n=1 Tax=Candidatus Amarobacter glycogenicus TaxID=3140699 RepID=UPI003135F320|nr:hypothetical protein [Dehalococcoidia bacterium]
MHRAVLGEHPLGERLDCRGVGDIHTLAENSRARCPELRRRLVERGLVDIRNRQLHALGGEA